MSETLSSSAQSSVALTQGLARNTFFNLLGWVWPMALSFVAVPYILSGLGTDAYGVFGIISVVAGYLGLLSGPMAMGNVRFMAEAFGRQDWDEFRKTVVTGLVVVGTLAAIGAAVMFLSADLLVRSVFKIPPPLVASAKTAFRLAAISFFLNGLTSGLNGIPAAIRRYDLLNTVSLSAGTLNTVGVMFAVWMGWGLVGAVTAQVISSGLSVAAFAVIAWLTWRQLPQSPRRIELDRSLIKRLISFSALLFGGNLASRIGLQIDRTIVAMLLGPSAATYYIVPAKITDQVPGLVGRLTMALYPLSAEGVAANRLSELRGLYVEMVRVLLWLTGFIASLLVILSRDILLVWVGPKMAARSWLILSLLGVSVVWRAPTGIAYSVCNGLGKASFNLIIGIMTLVSVVVPVSILAVKMGPIGAALGNFLGLACSNVIYDILTQRRFIQIRDWRVNLLPYAKVWISVISTTTLGILLPYSLGTWTRVTLGTLLGSLVYLASSLAVGMLRKDDIRFAFMEVGILVGRFKR